MNGSDGRRLGGTVVADEEGLRLSVEGTAPFLEMHEVSGTADLDAASDRRHLPRPMSAPGLADPVKRAGCKGQLTVIADRRSYTYELLVIRLLT